MRVFPAGPRSLLAGLPNAPVDQLPLAAEPDATSPGAVQGPTHSELWASPGPKGDWEASLGPGGQAHCGSDGTGAAGQSFALHAALVGPNEPRVAGPGSRAHEVH